VYIIYEGVLFASFLRGLAFILLLPWTTEVILLVFI